MGILVVDDGEWLVEGWLPELFRRLKLDVLVDEGGDGGLTDDVCRPSGVGELTRWPNLDVGKIFCVDLTVEDDKGAFNGGGDDGFEDFNNDREDELVLFNEPFMEGFKDDVTDGLWEDGERLRGLLLFVDEVNADNSESIELAEEVDETSGLSFFSLNPVANEAQPLVFFVVGPLVREELEFEVDGWVLIGLSDVDASDDWRRRRRVVDKGRKRRYLLLF